MVLDVQKTEVPTGKWVTHSLFSSFSHMGKAALALYLLLRALQVSGSVAIESSTPYEWLYNHRLSYESVRDFPTLKKTVVEVPVYNQPVRLIVSFPKHRGESNDQSENVRRIRLEPGKPRSVFYSDEQEESLLLLLPVPAKAALAETGICPSIQSLEGQEEQAFSGLALAAVSTVGHSDFFPETGGYGILHALQSKLPAPGDSPKEQDKPAVNPDRDRMPPETHDLPEAMPRVKLLPDQQGARPVELRPEPWHQAAQPWEQVWLWLNRQGNRLHVFTGPDGLSQLDHLKLALPESDHLIPLSQEVDQVSLPAASEGEYSSLVGNLRNFTGYQGVIVRGYNDHWSPYYLYKASNGLTYPISEEKLKQARERTWQAFLEALEEGWSTAYVVVTHYRPVEIGGPLLSRILRRERKARRRLARQDKIVSTTVDNQKSVKHKVYSAMDAGKGAGVRGAGGQPLGTEKVSPPKGKTSGYLSGHEVAGPSDADSEAQPGKGKSKKRIPVSASAKSPPVAKQKQSLRQKAAKRREEQEVRSFVAQSAGNKSSGTVSEAEQEVIFRETLALALRRYGRHCDKKGASYADSLYTLMLVYNLGGKPQTAEQRAQELYGLADLPIQYHALANFWLGFFKHSLRGVFNEEQGLLFTKADSQGNPYASYYLMLMHSGVGNDLSVVKWLNPVKFIQLAMAAPPKHQSFLKARMNFRGNLVVQPSEGELKGLHCLISQGYEHNLTFEFPLLEYYIKPVCSLFKPDSDLSGIKKTIEAYIKEFRKKYGSDEMVKMLYWFAVYVKTGEDIYLKRLVDMDTTPAYLCAAWGLNAKKGSFEQVVVLYRKSLPNPVAYQQLAELYMSKEQFVEARDVYQEGVKVLGDFLQGTGMLVDLRKGQQVCEARQTDLPKENLKEIEQEELHAAHKLLEAFEDKIEVLDWVTEGNRPVSENTVLTADLQKNSDDSDSKEFHEAVSQQPAGEESLVPADDEFLSVAKPLGSQELEGFTKVGDKGRYLRKTTRASATPTPPVFQSVKEANSLMAEGRLEEAEKVLNAVQAEKGSYEYYLIGQRRCWLHHLQAASGDYLARHSGQLSELELANQLLEKSQSQCMGLINSLANQVTEQAVAAAAEGVDTSEMDVSTTARNLELKDPRLKRQFGALYSSLGHLQTIWKNYKWGNEEWEKLHKKGTTYYRLANLIRGRSVRSDWSELKAPDKE